MNVLVVRGAICGTAMLLGWLGYSWMTAFPHSRLAIAHGVLGLEAGITRQSEQLRQRIETARRGIGSGAQSLQDDVSMSDLLGRLSDDLNALGVAGRRWKLEPEVLGPQFQELPVSVVFVGSFDTVGQLLHRVAEYPSAVRVSRVAMKRRDGASLDVTLELVNSSQRLADTTKTEAAP